MDKCPFLCLLESACMLVKGVADSKMKHTYIGLTAADGGEVGVFVRAAVGGKGGSGWLLTLHGCGCDGSSVLRDRRAEGGVGAKR